MTTREQDQVIDRMASQYGSCKVTPLHDGTNNVLVQPVLDEIEVGDPMIVPPSGFGVRRATSHEVNRVRRTR